MAGEEEDGVRGSGLCDGEAEEDEDEEDEEQKEDDLETSGNFGMIGNHGLSSSRICQPQDHSAQY